MGHQGEPPLQGCLGVVQLQLPLPLREPREDLAKVAIHSHKGFHESLLAQGGHGFDPQQQLLPLLVEHFEAFIQLREPLFQLLQLL